MKKKQQKTHHQTKLAEIQINIGVFVKDTLTLTVMIETANKNISSITKIA